MASMGFLTVRRVTLPFWAETTAGSLPLIQEDLWPASSHISTAYWCLNMRSAKGAVESLDDCLVPVNLCAPTSNVCLVRFHIFHGSCHEFSATVNHFLHLKAWRPCCMEDLKKNRNGEPVGLPALLGHAAAGNARSGRNKGQNVKNHWQDERQGTFWHSVPKLALGMAKKNLWRHGYVIQNGYRHGWAGIRETRFCPIMVMRVKEKFWLGRKILFR